MSVRLDVCKPANMFSPPSISSPLTDCASPIDDPSRDGDAGARSGVLARNRSMRPVSQSTVSEMIWLKILEVFFFCFVLFYELLY